MEKTEVWAKNVTREGQLVVPLDKPRSMDRAHAIIGATQTSGTFYTIQSGKQGYIKQLIITELSGTAGRFWLSDNSGYIIPPVVINANTTVTWDPRPAAMPTWGNILWQTEAGNRVYGRASLIVQVDPARNE